MDKIGTASISVVIGMGLASGFEALIGTLDMNGIRHYLGACIGAGLVWFNYKYFNN